MWQDVGYKNKDHQLPKNGVRNINAQLIVIIQKDLVNEHIVKVAKRMRTLFSKESVNAPASVLHILAMDITLVMSVTVAVMAVVANNCYNFLLTPTKFLIQSPSNITEVNYL